mmetsp:Transcript_36502/g.83725  ORF Transcript_36502/g.83725 Transcript_36502/m.83725 type:complete len:265 (+) Transcript_36502:2107-2901(+)
MAPSVLPAPSTRWISSMKRITPGAGAAATSASTAFSRSSNSPRYLAPATRAPMSSVLSPIPRMPSGMSLATMRCASPSTTAVFPTPGSPTSTGLFFVRRMRICKMRRIWSSRPITGSRRPAAALSMRSIPYFSSASNVDSALLLSTFRPERMASTAFRASASERSSRSSLATLEFLSLLYSARSKWSCATNASPALLAALPAASTSLRKARSGAACSGAGDCAGRLSSRRRRRCRTASASTPTFAHTRAPIATSDWSEKRTLAR